MKIVELDAISQPLERETAEAFEASGYKIFKVDKHDGTAEEVIEALKGSKIVLYQFSYGKTVVETNRRWDFVVIDEEDVYGVECKEQNVPGTAVQKVAHSLIDLNRQPLPYYFVYRENKWFNNHYISFWKTLLGPNNKGVVTLENFIEILD